MEPLPPFEADLSRASTLPSRCYHDREFHQLERERIFARTWQLVGRTEQVRSAGDYFTADVVGIPVVVLRDGQGRLRAFHNVCRHRAGSVAEGCGHRQTLQCSYHGWTYGLDGRLIATPEFEGVQDFDPAAFGLVPVAADSWGPLVFVHLASSPLPLKEALGPIPEKTKPCRLEELQLCERRDYLIACNWKVYVDNYLEGYHLPVAHPGLYKELDYAGYRVETFRYCSLQHSPIRPPTPGVQRKYQEEGQALYWWIFPNWMLNIYPDNLSTNVIVPLGPDRTLTIFEWYFPDPDGSETRDAIEKTIAFSDEIQQEDIKICEAVQVRLGTPAYDRGRFSVLRENGVHHFQGLIHEFLNVAGAR
jgi:phenylpropionate dioxygenase-like ring-hydroxylating dioxygenase large terminal subunit